MPIGVLINTVAIFLGGIADWTYEIYASGNIRDYYRDIGRIVF